ncbi:MAG: amidase family protein [Actinomycetota bacterium]
MPEVPFGGALRPRPVGVGGVPHTGDLSAGDLQDFDTREHAFERDPVWDWLVLWSVSRFKTQGDLMGTADWDRLSDTIKPQIEHGSQVSAVEYAAAQDACYDLNWQLEDALAQAPMVLTPTNAGQPPRLGSDGEINGRTEPGWVRFTYGINMTRHPAGSVCVGLTSSGTPIGLQIIGRHFCEAEVLAAMAVAEKVVAFERRPPAAV